MNQLLTKYAQDINPHHLLNEYPRPQLKRTSYLNLNGYWDFCISEDPHIYDFNEHILVPFSPESILSGINQILYPHMYAHYQREIVLSPDFMNDRVILHFGAVDQTCDVYINEKHVLTHVGGYVPFEIDITSYIDLDLTICIRLTVSDLSDTSYHLTGKQRLNHEGIFYTPQSGIWQTVWIESVSHDYIKDIKLKPLFDQSSLFIDLTADHFSSYTVKLLSQDQKLLKTHVSYEPKTIIYLGDFIPWTPEQPYLYQLEITHGKDHIQSYFGMRIFEKKRDHQGIMRFYLNHKPYFQSGILDQGYYSDGLLTPTSDQAMIDDIMIMKSLGFNMLRKHIKIEPLRWYYHCDRLGMLVWQDMLSGCEHKNVVFHHVLSIMHIHLNDRFNRLFGRKHDEGKKLYEKDLNIMLNHLKNVTSICVWVPFNEAWGQFDTLRIMKYVRSLDDERLIDHASGWSDHGGGDFYSRHIYYQNIKFSRRLAKRRITALTEYGGYSFPIENHRYNDDKLFGYKTFFTKETYETALDTLFKQKLVRNMYRGLSAIIYTQLSDVEDEVNGFLTYDRKVLKVDREKMKSLNEYLNSIFHEIMKTK